MTRQENEQFVKNRFHRAREGHIEQVAGLVEDAEAAVDEAARIFDAMIPDMAYVDNRNHPMAAALFDCSASLALYLALEKRGVDVHDFGKTVLTSIRISPRPEPEARQAGLSIQERFAGFLASAETSQKEAAPGEFVFEAFLGDRSEYDWGMNVKSCAICHAFSKYDAMDLVPYMCATDDVVSDRDNQGLRRTGTIALGAKRCDFRYKRRGEPLHLAPQYRDRIRDERND